MDLAIQCPKFAFELHCLPRANSAQDLIRIHSYPFISGIPLVPCLSWAAPWHKLMQYIEPDRLPPCLLFHTRWRKLDEAADKSHPGIAFGSVSPWDLLLSSCLFQLLEDHQGDGWFLHQIPVIVTTYRYFLRVACWAGKQSTFQQMLAFAH